VKHIWKTALLALLVGGCGNSGTEDFAVKVRRPVAAVFAPFSLVDTDDAARVFPGLVVNKTRPNDHELLYTIPGTGAFEATFRLTFEPTSDGATTIVHVAIDVPMVRAKIDGVDKVLSERKVESAVKKLLESAGESLEAGAIDNSNSKDFSQLLTGVAIATNAKFMDRIIEFKNDPEKLTAAMAALSGYDDYLPEGMAESPRGEAPEKMDPNEAAHESEYEQTAAQREMESSNREASAPDSSGDSSEGY
jgi:hypothetical protein